MENEHPAVDSVGERRANREIREVIAVPFQGCEPLTELAPGFAAGDDHVGRAVHGRRPRRTAKVDVDLAHAGLIGCHAVEIDADEGCGQSDIGERVAVEVAVGDLIAERVVPGERIRRRERSGGIKIGPEWAHDLDRRAIAGGVPCGHAEIVVRAGLQLGHGLTLRSARGARYRSGERCAGAIEVEVVERCGRDLDDIRRGRHAAVVGRVPGQCDRVSVERVAGQPGDRIRWRQIHDHRDRALPELHTGHGRDVDIVTPGRQGHAVQTPVAADHGSRLGGAAVDGHIDRCAQLADCAAQVEVDVVEVDHTFVAADQAVVDRRAEADDDVEHRYLTGTRTTLVAFAVQSHTFECIEPWLDRDDRVTAVVRHERWRHGRVRDLDRAGIGQGRAHSNLDLQSSHGQIHVLGGRDCTATGGHWIDELQLDVGRLVVEHQGGADRGLDARVVAHVDRADIDDLALRVRTRGDFHHHGATTGWHRAHGHAFATVRGHDQTLAVGGDIDREYDLHTVARHAVGVGGHRAGGIEQGDAAAGGHVVAVLGDHAAVAGAILRGKRQRVDAHVGEGGLLGAGAVAQAVEQGAVDGQGIDHEDGYFALDIAVATVIDVADQGQLGAVVDVSVAVHLGNDRAAVGGIGERTHRNVGIDQHRQRRRCGLVAVAGDTHCAQGQPAVGQGLRKRGHARIFRGDHAGRGLGRRVDVQDEQLDCVAHAGGDVDIGLEVGGVAVRIVARVEHLQRGVEIAVEQAFANGQVAAAAQGDVELDFVGAAATAAGRGLGAQGDQTLGDIDIGEQHIACGVADPVLPADFLRVVSGRDDEGYHVAFRQVGADRDVDLDARVRADVCGDRAAIGDGRNHDHDLGGAVVGIERIQASAKNT